MRQISLRIAAVVGVLLLGAWLGRAPLVELVQAQSFAAVFQLNDGPGPWFRCAAGSGCVAAGTQSLAVVSPGSAIKFIGGSETETVHTTTSLLWPLTAGGADADNMPFDQAAAFRGAQSVTLNRGMGGQGVLAIPNPLQRVGPETPAVLEEPAHAGAAKPDSVAGLIRCEPATVHASAARG
jgi:hypothetical protein